MLTWPQGHQEPGVKFGPQDLAKHLVGFDLRSFWFSFLHYSGP